MKQIFMFDYLKLKTYKDNKKCSDENLLHSILNKLLDLSIKEIIPFTEDETKLVRIKLGILEASHDIEEVSNYEIDKIFKKLNHYIEKSHDNGERLSPLSNFNIDGYKNMDISLIINSTKLSEEEKNKLLFFLYRNNINTLYDFLSFGKNDLYNLKMSPKTLINELINYIHILGFKLINELSLQDRRRILCDNIDKIQGCSISWILGDNNYKNNFSTIGELITYYKDKEVLPLELANSLISLNTDELNKLFGFNSIDDINKKKSSDKILYNMENIRNYINNYLINVSNSLHLQLDLTKLNLFVDALMDSSVIKISPLNEMETLMIRSFLFPAFGEDNHLSVNQIYTCFDKTDTNNLVNFRKILEKVIYSINRFPLEDDYKRLSTLLVSDDSRKYTDFLLSNLPINSALLLTLNRNNIFTLYDLLSYSKFEIKEICSLNRNCDIEKMFMMVQKLGLIFIDDIDELSKKETINKLSSLDSNRETFFRKLNNSSIFWMDFSYKKEYVGILASKYLTINSLKSIGEEVKPEHFKEISIFKLPFITKIQAEILSDTYKINSIYDLLYLSEDDIKGFLYDSNLFIESFKDFLNDLNFGKIGNVEFTDDNNEKERC